MNDNDLHARTNSTVTSHLSFIYLLATVIKIDKTRDSLFDIRVDRLMWYVVVGISLYSNVSCFVHWDLSQWKSWFKAVLKSVS